MCCAGLLKAMMFIFNGVICVAGAVILGVGIWITVDSDFILGIVDSVEGVPSELSQLIYVSYVLIGVGAVLLIIGFLGCCGAVMESRCMLLTFFSIVLIIFLIEVAGAIVLLVFQDVAQELFDQLEDEVRENIQMHYGETDSVTSVWNTFMGQFGCCGYKNYTDFTGSPFYIKTEGYPPMCCNKEQGFCTLQSVESENVDGCFVTLLELVEENAVIISAVALGIAALEIAAMVVSMILYNNIGRKTRA